MICKKMLLGVFLVGFCASHLKAGEEALSEDTVDAAEMVNTELEDTKAELENAKAAIKILTDALAEMTKILTNGMIEISKIEAAEIEAERKIETAKQWATIAKATISTVGMLILFSIFK
jgi:ribosomal protein L15